MWRRKSLLILSAIMGMVLSGCTSISSMETPQKDPNEKVDSANDTRLQGVIKPQPVETSADETEEKRNNRLKELFGGKNDKAKDLNEEDKGKNPIGIYYTTPHCEEMDIYEGDIRRDACMFYICQSASDPNNIVVCVTSLVDDSLNDWSGTEMFYDDETGYWYGTETSAYLFYDEHLGKLVMSGLPTLDTVICLENITENSAKSEERPEGEYDSEVGTNDDRFFLIYDLFNSGYLAVYTDNNSGESETAVAEANPDVYWVYTIYPTNGNFSTRLDFSADYDESSGDFYSFSSVTITSSGDTYDKIGTFYRGNYFDGYKTPTTFEGKYRINTGGTDKVYLELTYLNDSNTFQYNIIVNGEIIANGTEAIVVGESGYYIASTNFSADFSRYIRGQSETALIIIPLLGSQTYDMEI